MPSAPDVVAKQTTHYKAYMLWLFASPFAVSFGYMLICALVTGLWFFFFAGPYKSSFADLFPVSQWMWFPLLLIITGLAPMMYHNEFITMKEREKYFNQFCIKAKNYPRNQAAVLIYSYVYSMRGSKTPLTDALRKSGQVSYLPPSKLEYLSNYIEELPPGDSRDLLLAAWLDAVSNEDQSRPLAIISLAYIAAWVFCLSVPWVYWSFYEFYGFLGILFVTWPILAAVYGPTHKVNQFDSINKSYFIFVDYEERGEEFLKLAKGESAPSIDAPKYK